MKQNQSPNGQDLPAPHNGSYSVMKNNRIVTKNPLEINGNSQGRMNNQQLNIPVQKGANVNNSNIFLQISGSNNAKNITASPAGNKMNFMSNNQGNPFQTVGVSFVKEAPSAILQREILEEYNQQQQQLIQSQQQNAFQASSATPFNSQQQVEEDLSSKDFLIPFEKGKEDEIETSITNDILMKQIFKTKQKVQLKKNAIVLNQPRDSNMTPQGSQGLQQQLSFQNQLRNQKESNNYQNAQSQLQTTKKPQHSFSQQPQLMISSIQQQQIQENKDAAKNSLNQTIQEIVKPVLQRSEDIMSFKQFIDVKHRKLKSKFQDSSVFYQVLQKEQQRVQQENFYLNKIINQRIEDKIMIKQLQKQVKKMIKPYKGLQYDDFLHGEIHLNEIMVPIEQQQEQLKESRKRHMRILYATLKDPVVDVQIVVNICVQVSRQAFHNEIRDYYEIAMENILQTSQINSQEMQLFQNLRKIIQKCKINSKVSIHSNKKLDKMFKLLFDQNVEVQKQIQCYKDQFKLKILHTEFTENIRSNRYESANNIRLANGRNSILSAASEDIQYPQGLLKISGHQQYHQKKQSIQGNNISGNFSVDLTDRNTSVNTDLKNHSIKARSNNKDGRAPNQNFSETIHGNTMSNFFRSPPQKLIPYNKDLMQGPNQIMSHRVSDQLLPKYDLHQASNISLNHFNDQIEQHRQDRHNIYMESLDLKNYKKIGKLPYINHQQYTSNMQTPSNRSNNVSNNPNIAVNEQEHLIKLLHQSKTKKLLDPIMIPSKFDKTSVLSATLHQDMKPINGGRSEQNQKHILKQTLQKRHISSGEGYRKSQIPLNMHQQALLNFQIEDKNQSGSKALGSRNIKTSIPLKGRSKTGKLIKMINGTQSMEINKILAGEQKDNQQIEDIKVVKVYKFDNILPNPEFVVMYQKHFRRDKIYKFIILNRIKKLQKFYRRRLEMLTQNLQIIKKVWFKFLNKLQYQQNVHCKIVLMQHKKAAKKIEKIFKLFIQRKKEKKLQQKYNKVSYTQEQQKKTLIIQRFIRKFIQKKYKLGRLMLQQEEKKQKLYENLQNKYQMRAQQDSQMLRIKHIAQQESQNFHEYIYYQQFEYIQQIKAYENYIIQQTQDTFKEQDWNYNTALKEWSNSKFPLVLKQSVGGSNVGGANSQQQNMKGPLERLIDHNRKILMPEDQQTEEHIEDMSSTFSAYSHHFSKYERNFQNESLNHIKHEIIRRLEKEK